MSTESPTSFRQRPAGTVGRARDVGRDARILEAVLDLVSEQGTGAISMEAVAARAGVAKSTVYRRWGSLPDLLADAVDTITFPGGRRALTGNVRDDLVDGIVTASGCMDARRQRILSALLNTGKDQAELVEALRSRFVGAIAAAMAAAVQTAGTEHDTGEVSQVQWPDGSMDLAVVIGLLTSLPHITGRALDHADFERIVDQVLLPLWDSRRSSK
jgi:AcrR family transcriptional regulator